MFPAANYTAWWQRHMCINNLPSFALDSGVVGIRTHDLLIASPAPYRYATEPHVGQNLITLHCNGNVRCVWKIRPELLHNDITAGLKPATSWFEVCIQTNKTPSQNRGRWYIYKWWLLLLNGPTFKTVKPAAPKACPEEPLKTNGVRWRTLNKNSKKLHEITTALWNDPITDTDTRHAKIIKNRKITPSTYH